MLKLTRKDKINHFIWNLKQRVYFWDKTVKDLLKEVEKVENNITFQEFLISLHDQNKIKVEDIRWFFKKDFTK